MLGKFSGSAIEGYTDNQSSTYVSWFMTLKFNLLKLIFVEMGMRIRVWRSGDHIGSRVAISYHDLFFPPESQDVSMYKESI